MLNAKSLISINKRVSTALRSLHPVPRLHPEREEGQALVLVALLIVALLLFVGLGVDIGHLMARRAKLQSAVDASALSAAQMLVATGQTNPRIKAEQIMEANGIPLDSLAETLTVEEYAGLLQVHVAATQRVETFFMRLLPGLETANISAAATADLSSYSEINAKPFGQPGVVNELNLAVWGESSQRRHGDAYSPEYMNDGSNNPLYAEQPYGYLFRIDVPANFPASETDLVIEVFDPDTYNRPDSTPTYDRASTDNLNRAPEQFASCTNPAWDVANRRPGQYCSSGGARTDPGVLLYAFPDGKPAFWRVDEYRYPYNDGRDGGSHDPQYATRTHFELWHFDPHITTVFANPADLSDSGGPIGVYDIRDDPSTDLRWVQTMRITNFRSYPREDNGKWYFYLYVQGTEGSSENNYDLRVGPPQPLVDCRDYTADHCYVNHLYRDLNYDTTPVTGFRAQLAAAGYCAASTNCNANQPLTLWKDGGARIFAKRSLPLNLGTGSGFPLHLTQVPKEAAGQTLGIRHFDMDGSDYITYQMQKCGYTNLDDPNSWQTVTTGREGPTNTWVTPGEPDPELVHIPAETDPLYSVFFGPNCPSSLLRMQTTSSANQDTTVWEIPYIRPRLIR